MGAGHGMSAMCVSVFDAGNNIGPEGGAAIAEGITSCPALTEVGLGGKLSGRSRGVLLVLARECMS